jgi:hypothetical protein
MSVHSSPQNLLETLHRATPVLRIWMEELRMRGRGRGGARTSNGGGERWSKVVAAAAELGLFGLLEAVAPMDLEAWG